MPRTTREELNARLAANPHIKELGKTAIVGHDLDGSDKYITLRETTQSASTKVTIPPIPVSLFRSKTEARYADRLTAAHSHWLYEPIALCISRVGNRKTNYTPDFLVIEDEQLTFIEVKGAFVRKIGVLKFDMAVQQYGNLFQFEMWMWKNGEWACIRRSSYSQERGESLPKMQKSVRFNKSIKGLILLILLAGCSQKTIEDIGLKIGMFERVHDSTVTTNYPIDSSAYWKARVIPSYRVEGVGISEIPLYPDWKDSATYWRSRAETGESLFSKRQVDLDRMAELESELRAAAAELTILRGHKCKTISKEYARMIEMPCILPIIK